MRAPPILLALLAALILAAPAAAQPDPDAAYQVWAGPGELPAIDDVPRDAWNVEQRLLLAHEEGQETTASLHVPAGAGVLRTACDCAYNATEAAGGVAFTIDPAEPTGEVTLRLVTSQPTGPAAAFDLVVPEAARGNASLALFVPPAAGVQSNLDLVRTDPCGHVEDCVVHVFAAAGGPAWFAVTPAAPPAADPAEPGLPWLALAVGLAIGMLLWALLVSRGVVQRRSRKQVASTAAHEERAREGKAVLEGRKRALMAALKELEKAKMAAEIPHEAYDRLKAEYKRDTVTVMRALEQAS